MTKRGKRRASANGYTNHSSRTSGRWKGGSARDDRLGRLESRTQRKRCGPSAVGERGGCRAGAQTAMGLSQDQSQDGRERE